MRLLLCTFAAVLTFAGILAGCVATLLLVILMVRFPPLLIAVALACWIFCRLQAAPRLSIVPATTQRTNPQMMKPTTSIGSH